MTRIRCLVCNRTYAEQDVNLGECPHCFNGDMTQTEFVLELDDEE